MESLVKEMNSSKDAALLFPENKNGTEFIPFVSGIEPPNNGKPTEVAAAVVDVEKPYRKLMP